MLNLMQLIAGLSETRRSTLIAGFVLIYRHDLRCSVYIKTREDEVYLPFCSRKLEMYQWHAVSLIHSVGHDLSYLGLLSLHCGKLWVGESMWCKKNCIC
jgi:hypothetical protein